MDKNLKYIIGVDGGGSGTRVIISTIEGNIVAKAYGEPSALSLGIDKAWRSIFNTLLAAFQESKLPIPMLSECAIGLGLSGVNNKTWKYEFILRNPGFKYIEVDTDGYTTLLGAHDGKPGSIVALGTGSIGMILYPDGTRKSVSGWGYPTGDEASGSKIGMDAVALCEKVLDGRKKSTVLTQKILDLCGNTEDKLLHWLSHANQNSFATIAPIVFECAENEINDADAKELLQKASSEVELMLLGLDPKLEYPFSICGRLGEALIPYLSEQLKKINQKPAGNSAHGALNLIRRKLNEINSR